MSFWNFFWGPGLWCELFRLWVPTLPPPGQVFFPLNSSPLNCLGKTNFFLGWYGVHNILNPKSGSINVVCFWNPFGGMFRFHAALCNFSALSSFRPVAKLRFPCRHDHHHKRCKKHGSVCWPGESRVMVGPRKKLPWDARGGLGNLMLYC